jgi:FkbM family methyltransferase
MEEVLKLTPQSILKLKNSRPIAVCWAGFYGKVCFDILQSHMVQASYYLAKSPGVTEYCGLPVYDLNNLPYPPEETTLIVAMDPYQLPNQIQKIKAAVQFAQLAILDEQDIINHCLHYDLELFRNRGMDVHSAVLDFGFMRLHNPMMECPAYQKAFALQAKDLILPEMGDTTWMTEGPYTFGPAGLRSGDVVLDCGANIGIFSAYAAAKGCCVFAFEPHTETQAYFMLNQELYSKQIQLIPKAIGARCGNAHLNVYGQDWGANSIVMKLDAPDLSIECVDVITIDSFIEQYGLSSVDFIKADIEGAERQLLLGAQKILKRDAPKLAICTYHLPDDAEILPQLIRQGNPQYHIEATKEKIFAWPV